MDSDSSIELQRLRRKIARIDRKYQSGPLAAAAEEERRWRPVTPALDPSGIENSLPGEVLDTPLGNCFLASRNFAFHRRHGNADISALSEMDGTPLGIAAPPARWAFLDTETTGIVGGTGTYCFLIGVGSLEGRDFRVRQFLMRDYIEEAAQLHALAEHLARFDVLVTYNGKTFDAPLLETRFRMLRQKPAHQRLEHFDLLHSARRLFRLRLSNCRLVELEKSVLGFEREGDLPGEMIPYYFFDYLRTHNALKMIPILHHNVMDIVTLACLTALVLAAVGAPESPPLAHPVDLYSLAAWVARVGHREQAISLYRRVLGLTATGNGRALPDHISWRAMGELAALYKHQRDWESALPLWTELAAAPNGARIGGLVELAKYYEHRARDYTRALDAARSAIGCAPSEDLAAWQRRISRLEKKAAGQKAAESRPARAPRPRSRKLAPAPLFAKA